MKTERLAIGVALAAVVVLAWLYLFDQAAGMRSAMAGMDRNMAMPPRTPFELGLLLVMWWVMMTGMMLPSAAPMILTFATVNRGRRARAEPFVPTSLFAAGYLLAWGGFSLAATVAQWGLERLALLSPMDMASDSRLLGGLLFLAAGFYQLTPLKHACLGRCRSPLDFVLHHWRDGPGGALVMGMEHGLYCLGCCWILMLLLFVGGVMNLLWVAALGIVVLAEKLFPAGPWIARLGGMALMAYGVWLLVMGSAGR